MNNSHPQPSSESEPIIFLELARLLNRLHELGMLDQEFTFPQDWRHRRQFSAEEVSNLIRGHLTREGWQRLLEAFRYHNRQPEAIPWDLSNASDFLQSLEFALVSDQLLAGKERTGLFRGFGSQWFARLINRLRQRKPAQSEKPLGPARPAGGRSRLSAFKEWLGTWMKRARAEAWADRALDQVASYITRSMRDDLGREAFLERVDRLRSQMREELEVFCEEEGIPMPKTRSREEAVYLHLLSAFFVALAEAEERLRQHGSRQAQQRTSVLEENRPSMYTDEEVLSELLTVLQEIDPLREGLMRRRIQHRIRLGIESITTAVGGGLWGAVEAIIELLIAGIARFAPIVAPPMLVGLATLIAQTLTLGFPLTLREAVLFCGRALWNATLTLGATLLAYGSWLYFTKRSKSGTPRISTQIGTDQADYQTRTRTA